MSKEFDSKMKFRNQTSLKRLTQKKDSLTTKPSLIAILLVLIAFLQVPISLKASLNIFAYFLKPAKQIKLCFFVMTEINLILL